MIRRQESLEKTLKIVFIASILLSIAIFLFVYFAVNKYTDSGVNVILERYAIAITLIGIPVALKLFHSQVSKLDKNNQQYLKKYQIQYALRLFILEGVYLFNLISFYITGGKNFIFMIIITIFALFLCAPQKAHLEYDELENN